MTWKGCNNLKAYCSVVVWLCSGIKNCTSIIELPCDYTTFYLQNNYGIFLAVVRISLVTNMNAQLIYWYTYTKSNDTQYLMIHLQRHTIPYICSIYHQVHGTDVGCTLFVYLLCHLSALCVYIPILFVYFFQLHPYV